MTDIPWEQTVLEEDAKTHQPTSDDAPTHKPNTEDSFINNRQPKYKDAKAADKVRKQGKVPRNTPGFSTMEETGFTSNFTTDQATAPVGMSPA
ncbi:hypothetical protein AAVH_33822 [Aphelenchoides avenae]|nr:hypothetical protein AAVH_33822 [Aphelenchus avenae]